MTEIYFANAVQRGARDDALAVARRKRDQHKRFTAALLVRVARVHQRQLLARMRVHGI